MSVLVVGLSHRSVPLEILERVAISRAALPKALADIAGRDFVSEAVILSTCHRTEVYVVAERFHGAVQDVRRFFAEHGYVLPEDIADHVYTYHDEAAVEHLFSVASGIDSVVVGESQILGQVRDAWHVARTDGAAGRTLGGLFRHALEVGKRSRTETAVARGITSLSQAALAMARERIGSLEGRRIVVVGTGEVGEGMVTDLAAAAEGAEVLVASRTRERALDLAERVGGKALDLDDMGAALGEADLVLASTAARGAVVAVHDLCGGSPAATTGDRAARPVLVVDLGMPRNVDPAVSSIPGVTLLDLDALRAYVEVGLGNRRREVARVRTVVAHEVARYMAEVRAREVAPVVAALRQRAEDIRSGEMQRLRSPSGPLTPEQVAAVDSVTRGVVAKLLHGPSVRLKEAAGSPRGERLADTVRDLFGLDSDSDSPASEPSSAEAQGHPAGG